MNLTKKQQEILNFIKEYRRKHSTSPSQVEIGKHFGITTAAANSHIQKIAKKGVIFVIPFQHNSIQLAPSEERYSLIRNPRGLLVFKNGDLEIPISAFEGYKFKIIE